MFFRRIRYYFFILFGLSILASACIFFRQPILKTLLDGCVNGYCRYYFNSPLEFKELYREGDFWVFSEPGLYHKGAQLSADKFLCSVSFRPWERELELKLVVDNSQIDLREKVSDIQQTLKEIISRTIPYWLFKLRLEFTIPQGRISWCHHEDKIDSSAQFRLHATSDMGHSRAELELFLDEADPTKNRLLAVLDQKPESPFETTFSFSELDCAKLSTICRSVGRGLHSWEIEGGILNGDLSLESHKNKTFLGRGHAVLRQFDCSGSRAQIAGHFDEVLLDLEAAGTKKETPQLAGKLRIPSGYLVDKNTKGSRWRVSELYGELEAVSENRFQLSSHASGFYLDRPFGLKIDGEINPFAQQDPQATIRCLLSQPSKEDAEIRLFLKEPFSPYSSLNIHFEKIQKEDLDLAQTIIQKINPFEMRRGQLQGSMTCFFEQGQLSQVDLHDLSGKELAFLYPAEKLHLDLDGIRGALTVDFKGDAALETLDASVELHQVKLVFPGPNGQACHVRSDRSDLRVEKGVLQNTEIRGSFEELEGIIKIDWKRRRDALKIDLTGPAEVASKLVPEMMRSHVDQVFSKQQIHLSGSLSRTRNGARFAGQIDLMEKTPLASVAFGFVVQKSSEELWNTWPADRHAVAFWKENGQEALQALIPPILSPTILLESNWIRSQAGLDGFVIRDGWFKTSVLRLEKYVSPLLFLYDEATLSGEGKFWGLFDHENISVSYEAENVSLENPFLSMRVSTIKKEDIGASHYFDLKRGIHYGTLPIRKGSYLEKGSGLVFSEVDALVVFERSNVHLSQLTAYCHGIEAHGSVDIDFGLPHDGIFSVQIHADQAKGKIEQLQEILLKLDPETPFAHSGLRGDVAIEGGGGHVSLSFAPQKFDFDAQIEGGLANMHWPFPDSEAKLERGQLKFAYDHRQKSLKLGNLSAELLFPGQLVPEKYLFSSDYIKFFDYTKSAALFDVSVKDRNRDLIHFVGRSYRQGEHTIFHFEPDLTRIDDLKPRSLSLVLNDSYTVERFAIDSDIRLGSLLKTLQLFQRSKLLSKNLPLHHLLKTVHMMNGSLQVRLNFDAGKGGWNWDFSGKKMGINSFSVEEASFRGENRGEEWTFQELRLDQLALSGKGISRNGDWYFDKMHASCGDHLNADFSIDYLASDHAAKGYLEKLDIDLSPFLASMSYWKKNLPNGSIHGILSASGNFAHFFQKNGSQSRSEAVLNGNIKSWGIAGVLFKDVDQVACQFASDQGITIGSLKTEILEPETRNPRGAYQLDKLTYDPATGACALENLNFQIPSHHLPWICETLHRDFPKVFTKDLADIFGCCKLQGQFEGTLNLDYTVPYTGLQLRLKDGAYTFMNADHEVKHFILEYDPFEFRIESRYRLGNDFVWLHARSTSPNLSEGALILTEASAERYALSKERPGIHILWDNHPLYGTSIRTIDGCLHGLDFDMKRDPLEPLSEKVMHLMGSVSIDGSKIYPLLPPQIARKIADWKVGQGYVICGKWEFSKSGSDDYGEQLSFTGILEGKECELKGYQFASLAAHLQYTPRAATLRDLILDDPSGTLKIGRIALTKEGADWYFSVPEAKVEKFRPALLRSMTARPPQVNKSLVISTGVLKGCQGRIDDVASFSGTGEFRFLNKQKRRMPNGLFQIPADLLSRIGLDPSLMTPVVGTVEYRIGEGEIQLVKFKEMYSDSKLSKFYLVPSYRSRVDFDGNLDIHVGMKQYNLLFKFAELCTIGIGGDLDKPTYSLQRNPERSSKKE